MLSLWLFACFDLVPAEAGRFFFLPQPFWRRVATGRALGLLFLRSAYVMGAVTPAEAHCR
jgi:Na+-transporting NADH:ubiquinone oxidoreductase subunit NqrB